MIRFCAIIKYMSVCKNILLFSDNTNIIVLNHYFTVCLTWFQVPHHFVINVVSSFCKRQTTSVCSTVFVDEEFVWNLECAGLQFLWVLFQHIYVVMYSSPFRWRIVITEWAEGAKVTYGLRSISAGCMHDYTVSYMWFIDYEIPYGNM